MMWDDLIPNVSANQKYIIDAVCNLNKQWWLVFNQGTDTFAHVKNILYLNLHFIYFFNFSLNLL